MLDNGASFIFRADPLTKSILKSMYAKGADTLLCKIGGIYNNLSFDKPLIIF